MFSIAVPKSFRVGDTIDCTVNGERRQLTWRDEGTLVIEPDDPRVIVVCVEIDDKLHFGCGDQGGGPGEYVALHINGGVYLCPAKDLN